MRKNSQNCDGVCGKRLRFLIVYAKNDELQDEILKCVKESVKIKNSAKGIDS